MAANPAAAKDLIETALMEKSLVRYFPQAWRVIEPATPFIPNWHVDCIAEHLEAVTAGEITRIIFNMPPRYGKSNMITVMWPSWEWIRAPHQRWMFVSHALRLSTMHSISRRTLIDSDWYQRRWGHRYALTSDQNAKLEFDNTHRGKMFATAVGASTIGGGGNRVVIDDPHDPEEADSEVERKKGINYFRKTLYSRIDDKNYGAFIVVMQRLHQEDLTGHLLAEGGWVHVKLTGEARVRTVVRFPRSGREIVREEGEPLCAARENKAQLAKARSIMTPYVYAAQYDQEPAPPGGGMFKGVWFADKTVRAMPIDAVWVRFWDKAGTKGGTGARTAGVKIGRDMMNRYYICRPVKGRWSAYEREDWIRRTAETDGINVDVWVEQEPGSGGKESAQNTIINLAGFNCRAHRVTGDKEARARPLAAQCEVGNVYLVQLPEEEVWIPSFLGELELFPNSSLKDQVDAASGAFNKVALNAPAGDSAVCGERKNFAEGLVGTPSSPSPVAGSIGSGYSGLASLPMLPGRPSAVAGPRWGLTGRG